MSTTISSVNEMDMRSARISLERAVKGGRNILLVSAPGCGKTSMTKSVVKKLNWGFELSTPAMDDPTDAKGLGMPSSDFSHAKFLPFGTLHRLLNATEPTVWFIDDLGQANEAVQKAYMPWLLERRCGNLVLPDCVRIVGATNGRQHKAGVSGILEPVKSRFHKIIHIKSNYLVWREDFAVPNGVNPLVLAYLDWSCSSKSNTINKFVASNDLTNTPTERTWTNASDLINDYLKDSPENGDEELYDPTSILYKDVCGAIGSEEAGKLWTFLKLREELKEPISSILENPHGAHIPNGLEAQFLVTNSLVSAANDSNFENIYQYAIRLYDQIPRELSVALMNDILSSKSDLQNTNTFVKIATSSQFGSAFAGRSRMAA